MKVPFLIIWTVAGAGIGYVFAPTYGAGNWAAEATAWSQLWFTLGGAALGLIGGIVHDHAEKRRP